MSKCQICNLEKDPKVAKEDEKLCPQHLNFPQICYPNKELNRLVEQLYPTKRKEN